MSVVYYGGDTVFSPDDIDNLVLWHDADDLDTITKDGADLVSQWDDKSASLSHATQLVAANKPTYETAQINGLPTVSCTAFGDFLHQDLTLGDAKTVIFVYKNTTVPFATSFQSLFTLKKSATEFAELILSAIGAAYREFSWRHDFLGAGASVGFADVLDTMAHIFIHTYDNGGNTLPASYTARLDEAAEVVVASGTFARTGTDKGAIGARVNSADVAAAGFIGQFGEILMYSRVLTAGEITQIEDYVTDKWGALPS